MATVNADGEEGAEGDATGAPEGGEEAKGPSDEAKKTSIEDAQTAAQNTIDIKTLQSQHTAQMNSRSSLASGDGQRKQIQSSMMKDTIADEYVPSEADLFDEFLAQVSFKRTTEIDGYSSTKIQFTFIPMKLTDVSQKFTLFLENQDYTKPIPIQVSGTCVNVPIYVEKEEYNLNVLVYEQFYRENIILHNRGANAMKI